MQSQQIWGLLPHIYQFRMREQNHGVTFCCAAFSFSREIVGTHKTAWCQNKLPRLYRHFKFCVRNSTWTLEQLISEFRGETHYWTNNFRLKRCPSLAFFFKFLQAWFRGYKVRSRVKSLKVKAARRRIKAANMAATESMKLCNRTRSALDYLLRCKNLTTIFDVLVNLGKSNTCSEIRAWVVQSMLGNMSTWELFSSLIFWKTFVLSRPAVASFCRQSTSDVRQ